MPRRLKKRHAIVLAAALLAVFWAFGLPPLQATGKLSCAAVDSSPVSELRQCVAAARASWDRVYATLCPDGACDPDADLGSVTDDLSTLQASLDALPFDWARPKLFPLPSQMTIPANAAVTLYWPSDEGDRRVLLGAVRLLSAGTRLDLETTVIRNKALTEDEQARKDRGEAVERVQETVVCSATLSANVPPLPSDDPETRLAVTALSPTALVMTCRGAGDCVVGLDSGSAKLARESKCPGK